ncbi:hypothetical protein EV127DRAFT_340365 [Xylaria flabelliformis]|nr:hypothetical protein EV127DRAFT_340365 [Xylaria flabelliformis]
MANLTLTGAELLYSGEYSDFSLVCEGQELRVHKGIVCPQSSVIATALKSEFKEAKTNTIEVNFELAILKCMLEYMYTGDYKDEPAQPVQLLAQPSQAANITISQRLIYHARVNSIADYYNVTSLAEVSITKIQKLLDERWSADAFCDLIQEAAGFTGNKNLREVLARAAACNVSELTRRDIFAEGMIANDMAAEVLKASMKTIEDRTREVAELKMQLSAEKAKVDTLDQNLDEIANVLTATGMCFKSSCKHPFGCEIQRPKQNAKNLWFVRCTKCNSRYSYDKSNGSVIRTPQPRRTRSFDYTTDLDFESVSESEPGSDSDSD